MTTAAGLRARILSGTQTFTLSEAKQYVADVLEAGALQGHERFRNHFLHEFWPLTAIAEEVGNDRTRIVFTGMGNGADAALLFGSSMRAQIVELTAALDGQQHALQMEHLALYGRAPVTAKIKATGKRATRDRRIEETEAEVRSAEDHRKEVLAQMVRALESKKHKAQTRRHYHGAWLGIVIPNDPPAEFKKARFDPICATLLSDPANFAPFSRVFVVSTVGDYLFDSSGIPLLKYGLSPVWLTES